MINNGLNREKKSEKKIKIQNVALEREFYLLAFV